MLNNIHIIFKLVEKLIRIMLCLKSSYENHDNKYKILVKTISIDTHNIVIRCRVNFTLLSFKKHVGR